jgi:IS30 family transposase
MRTVNRRRVRLHRKRKIDANPRLRETVWAMVKDKYLPQQILRVVA